jgi:hypothetical protein
MTTAMLSPFFNMRPFQPFTLYLVDGRTIEVGHPDLANLGRAGLGVWILHPTGQIESIDTSLITSIRTRDPADIEQFIR